MKIFHPLLLILAAAASLFTLTGCGPGYNFKQAQELEKKGYFVEAGVRYEKLVKDHPQYARSPEALYRLARIYQKKIKIYSHAHRYFRELIETYPAAEPWITLARKGLFNSPDYFPLTTGSFWIEGDSQTAGRNMRAEWNCTLVSTGTYLIDRRVFAGRRIVTNIKRYFRKQDMELQESLTPQFNSVSVILAYPFGQGRSWKTSRDGRAVVFTVVAENIALKVSAGEFVNCLKISEEYPELPGTKKYNYYAADVGWVLTTVEGRGGNEHRNTELLSYKINPEE